MVAAAVSATVNPKQLDRDGGGGGGGGGILLNQHASEPPLLPSDPDNAITLRHHKYGKVISRYLSTSSSSTNSSSVSTKRRPSATIKYTSKPVTKPSQSVEISMNLKTGDGNVVRALQHSMTHNNRDISAIRLIKSKPPCNPEASDTETVFSGSTTLGNPQSCFRNKQVKRVPQGIMVSARSWQETTNWVPRSSPKKNTAHSKPFVPDKFGNGGSPLSSPKGVFNSGGRLSPFHGPVRPASPNKLGASSNLSPLRGMSPRLKHGLGDHLVNRPSILSLVGDVIKIGQNKVSDAHLLRLLHNRLLQWRFVNARADATLSSKMSNAEKSLYNAWATTSKLQESVRAKRAELQLLRQNLKLNYILKGQMIFLDEWAILDHDYCSYLSGATKALMASTLRLPIVCGARANVPKLKDAICSAVDVMQLITSSISSLLSKVAKVNSLAAELGKLSTNELVLLYQCKELLSAAAAMRVKESSLRTDILQLNRLLPPLTTKLYRSPDFNAIPSSNTNLTLMALYSSIRIYGSKGNKKVLDI